MVTAVFVSPIGYFDWMSDDDDQLTHDRLKMIIHHATHDPDEVLIITMVTAHLT